MLRQVLLDPGDAVVDVGLGLADDDVVVGRPRDLVERPADRPRSARAAPSDLCAKPSGVPSKLVYARVLGRDAQGLLLAAARDPQRRTVDLQGQRGQLGAVDLVVPTVQRRGAVGPQLLEDLHALVEHRDPLAGAREAVAVRAPLVLVPAGADAHLDAAAAR